MLKQPNFFHSQPSTLPKKALEKFYLSETYGLSFMISSVAPTRSSTFDAYLITKIGNRTANSSERIEKNFVDLRNMFSDQENIRMFFSKQVK